MSKVFKLFFFIFFIFFLNINVFASSGEIDIISRQEWWANENYRYLDSSEWQAILERWKKASKNKVELSEYQKQKAKIESEKVKKANNFLINNYWWIIWVKNVIKEENGHKLAWPLAYSKKKVAIVVHHTDSDIKPWDDNYEAIRKIYKYHALTRAWWDIGYNYLIWTNWEIFEWRAWWDFVVWAHDKWNNQATIWISLIWNYSREKAPKKQLESLEKLTKFLIKKYNININKKQAFFSWCVWISKECQEKPLIINYDYPIIGHRDAGHTACPWDELYEQLQEMRKRIWVWKNDKVTEKLDFIKVKLDNLSENKLLNILLKIELALDKLWDSYKDLNKIIILKDIKKHILDIEKKKTIKNLNSNIVEFDKSNKIKVKLSYPLNDHISFKIAKNKKISLDKKKNEYILNILSWENDRKLNLNFIFKDNKLFIKNREIIDFDKVEYFRIHNLNSFWVIEISSWDRKPIWDKTWNLNDNKFRWDIVLYSKNNKLVVVNELYLNDYLKWLWEVSDSTNPEKIKAIIVLARTYARWYMTKARKFAWEWFDASDDPNVFQKYLWYWLEKRSPKVNKIVDETTDYVITYNWELIKPWYFSSSDGKTKSFIEYCENASWVPDCAHPEKFPFLVWVENPGWIWKKQAWHWVWVSWTWVEYLSNKWWSFSMIIKYFLKWVEVELYLK